MLEDELDFSGASFPILSVREFRPKEHCRWRSKREGLRKEMKRGLNQGGKIAVRKMSSQILLILEIDWCMFA
jgi:hypothetical protein